MYQGEMRLSASDSIAFMNRTSRHKVACAVHEADWHETIKTVPEAVQWANYCEQHALNDCYVSDNTFGKWRGFGDVKEITRLAVDLDHYHTVHKDLSAAQLWDAIAVALPWLPQPTIIEDSGRGAYLKWKLSRPLPINAHTRRFGFIGQWQLCQDFITAQLAPWGADPKASDVTRVLRVPGTINSRNYARAQAWTSGPEYEFSDLKTALNDEYKRQKPPPKPIKGKKARTAGLERLFNWHSLAWARLKDIEKLAQLRGGRLTDHRRRAIFVYAVEACHYCRSTDRLKLEIERFIGSHIHDAGLYALDGKKTHLKAVLRRFEAQEARGHWEWYEDPQTGKYSASNRYLLKSSTIIEDLAITASEQRHMKALISPQEKYRRKVSKRRQAGVQERSVYLGTAKQRKEKARQLRSEGVKIKDIARRLGVETRTIRRYLR